MSSFFRGITEAIPSLFRGSDSYSVVRRKAYSVSLWNQSYGRLFNLELVKIIVKNSPYLPYLEPGWLLARSWWAGWCLPAWGLIWSAAISPPLLSRCSGLLATRDIPMGPWALARRWKCPRTLWLAANQAAGFPGCHSALPLTPGTVEWQTSSHCLCHHRTDLKFHKPCERKNRLCLRLSGRLRAQRRRPVCRKKEQF